MRRLFNYYPEGGGPKVIDPLSLGGLQLYLRADQVDGADGSTVAGWTNNRWPDLSGNGRHAIAVGGATSPVLRKTGADLSPTGKQVVQWGAAANNLKSFMGALPIDGSLGWTFVAYYKSVALSAGHNNDLFYCPTGKFFEMVANSNVAFNGYDRDGRPGFDSSPPGPALKTWNSLATLGWHLQIVTLVPPIITGGTVLGQMDGVAMTPSTFTNWNVSLEGDLYVGNTPGSNSDLEGCYAALLIYNRAYTGGTLQGLSAFLRAVC